MRYSGHCSLWLLALLPSEATAMNFGGLAAVQLAMHCYPIWMLPTWEAFRLTDEPTDH